MSRPWWIVALALAAVTGCSRSDRAAPGEKIPWITDPAAAFAKARETGKPVMLDLWQIGCSSCENLDEKVWARSEVVAASKDFVAAKVESARYPDLAPKYSVSGYPTTLFLTPGGKEVGRVRGAAPYEDMLEAMRDALRQAGSK